MPLVVPPSMSPRRKEEELPPRGLARSPRSAKALPARLPPPLDRIGDMGGVKPTRVVLRPRPGLAGGGARNRGEGGMAALPTPLARMDDAGAAEVGRRPAGRGEVEGLAPPVLSREGDGGGASAERGLCGGPGVCLELLGSPPPEDERVGVEERCRGCVGVDTPLLPARPVLPGVRR